MIEVPHDLFMIFEQIRFDDWVPYAQYRWNTEPGKLTLVRLTYNMSATTQYINGTAGECFFFGDSMPMAKIPLG